MMKYILLAVVMIFVGCGDTIKISTVNGDDDKSELQKELDKMKQNDIELKEIVVRSDGLVIQNTIEKTLIWVSDDDENKKACLAIHPDNEAELNTSKTFCQDLSFAGYNTGWRKPTVDEMSNFIVKTIDADILPGYYAPCKFLIGTDDVNPDKVVLTRYAEEAEYGNAGLFSDITVSDVLDGNTNRGKLPVGLRCVRDFTE